MKKCKICGDKTKVAFNIDFKKVPICEGCAESIFLQQAQWYVKQGPEVRKGDPEFNYPPQKINMYKSLSNIFL